MTDAEALELVEFDPTVESEGDWVPPQPILTFLEKHFSKSLIPEEQDKILKDFPKPQCKSLEVPTLDEQVRDHLKKKRKEPHFGSEKTLYKPRLHGPLTCLWADLLDAMAKIRREDVILLLQRVLFLVADLSNSIAQEWRQIAYSRLNDTGKKSATLFRETFMEKAIKRMEEEKTLAKFTAGSQKEAPAAKCRNCKPFQQQARQPKKQSKQYFGAQLFGQSSRYLCLNIVLVPPTSLHYPLRPGSLTAFATGKLSLPIVECCKGISWS